MAKKKPKSKAVTPEDLNWDKIKPIDGRDTYYQHHGREWVVEPIEALGVNGKPLRRPHYIGKYVGPARTHSLSLISYPTVIKAKQSVQKVIDHQASKSGDLREQAVISLRLGRTALAIDTIFDYIDERFDALERKSDESRS